VSDTGDIVFHRETFLDISKSGLQALCWSLIMTVGATVQTAAADDLQVQIHKVSGTGVDNQQDLPKLGDDGISEYVVYSGQHPDQFGGSFTRSITAQRLDVNGVSIGNPLPIMEPTYEPLWNDFDVWDFLIIHTDQRRLWFTEKIEKGSGPIYDPGNLAQIASPKIHFPYFVWLQWSTGTQEWVLMENKMPSLLCDACRPVDLPPQLAASQVGSIDVSAELLAIAAYNPTDSTRSLWIRNHSTLAFRQIVVSSSLMFDLHGERLATNGEWVVWEEYNGVDYFLKAFNYITDEARTIAQGPVLFLGATDGNYVAYTAVDDSDGSWQVFIHRFSDGSTHQVTRYERINSNEPGRAFAGDIRGDKIAYQTGNEGIYIANFFFCSDTGADLDNDGVFGTCDLCSTEDATGLDVDSDGCIDSPGGLVDLITSLVTEQVISSTMQNSLLAKLGTADASAGRDNICAAINEMEAFISHIAAQSGKKISAEAAQTVISYAESAIAALRVKLPLGTVCQ
jgi:hypothetical protein